MRKDLKINMHNLLKTIVIASDKDFHDQFLFNTLAGFLKYKLENKEIENFAYQFLSEQGENDGYTKDDYDQCINILEDFREHYCR